MPQLRPTAVKQINKIKINILKIKNLTLREANRATGFTIVLNTHTHTHTRLQETGTTLPGVYTDILP